jgi:hypothetical protein
MGIGIGDGGSVRGLGMGLQFRQMGEMEAKRNAVEAKREKRVCESAEKTKRKKTRKQDRIVSVYSCSSCVFFFFRFFREASFRTTWVR